MATLFFSLRGVPEDESEDVRELLSENEIDFYETSAGNWGMSMPAIWIKNKNDLPKAIELLNDYQHKRCIEQRALYNQLKKDGRHKRISDVFREKPVQFLSYTGFIIFIFYFSIKLLFELGL